MPFRFLQHREFAAVQPVELATTLRPTTGGPYRLTPLVRVELGALRAGDVIDVAACSVQVSTKLTHATMVGSHLILCDSTKVSAGFSQNEWGRWVEVTEAMTTNVTATDHHHPIRTSGRYVVAEDWDNAFLVFLVYAAWPTWNGTSTLTVDRDFGRLEGYVARPITAQELAEFIAGGPAPEPEEPPAPAPEPEPPAPAPEPPPAPPPEPDVELIPLWIAPDDAAALQRIAAQIPTA